MRIGHQRTDRSIYMNFLDGPGIGAAKPIGGGSDEVFVLRNEADPARQREQRSSRTDFGLESTGSPERSPLEDVVGWPIGSTNRQLSSRPRDIADSSFPVIRKSDIC
jgi:hypothetical protein